MEDLRQRLQNLFVKSDWSFEDRNWLLNYLEKNDTTALQQIMQQQFNDSIQSGEKLDGEAEKQLLERIREKIRSMGKPAKVIRFNSWKRVAAAVIIVLLGTGAVFLLSDKKKPAIAKTNPVAPYHNDVAPGGNKALLTLADGSTIVLDSAQIGTLSQQGNIKVLKLDNGQLAYTALGSTAAVVYNTISTPRGGQYQLTLADGSKVWLNAASSLRFPAGFTGKERKVELTGEAYFEIAKNASMPFRVNVAGRGEVEVLGTHFNINSYDDEMTINTTLLEGKVKVSALGNEQPVTSNQQFLSAGQQAQLNSNGQLVINKSPDIKAVMAWKNGKFDFGEATEIATIMRQIARWYDVQVEYKGMVSGEIGGSMSRDVNASKVFEMLGMTGSVKFQINGKKVMVVQNKK